MGSFRRALLGYRRDEVDAAMVARDTRLWELERQVVDVTTMWRSSADEAARSDAEMRALSGMVMDREREIRSLTDRLREANERHERTIGSLESVAGRLEEVQAQARGQATRIRMKALREAVEVSRRAQELVEAQPGPAAGQTAGANRAGPDDAAAVADGPGVFQGRVTLEIGPLDDFSQLVGFEDAIGRLGASTVSVERFSEGRATISVRLDEPIDLVEGLERTSALDFDVRRTTGDTLCLEVTGAAGPAQQAA